MSLFLEFYPPLVRVAVASFVLLAVASAAIVFSREPARKVRIIQLTLLALLVLPWLSLMPSYPHLSILPRLGTVDAVIVPETEREFTEADNGGVGARIEPLPALPSEDTIAALESSGEAVWPECSAAIRVVVNAIESAPVGGEPTVLPPAIKTVPHDIVVDRVMAAGLLADFRIGVVAAYLICAAAIAAWALVGLFAAWRLLRASSPADDRLRALLCDIASSAGTRVSLRISSRVNQPCALAWWPTTIVLPESWCRTNDAQRLRWILAHEWSHVVRGDVWSWSLSGLLRVVYFYHPLIWWLRRELQLNQDFLADAQAVLRGSEPEDYAEFLTSCSARWSQPLIVSGLGIGGHASNLHRRVIMLVENPRPLEVTSPARWNFTAISLAVLILAGAAALRESGAEADEPQRSTIAAKLSDDPPGDSLPAPPPVPDPQPLESQEVDGSHKIAAGDVLQIDVVSSSELESKSGIPVLLRPEFRVTVSQTGTISLGSRYGRVDVKGETLEGAQDAIAHKINELLGKAALEQGVATMPMVNVRVELCDHSAGPLSVAQLPARYTTSPFVDDLSNPQTIEPGDHLNVQVVGIPDDFPIQPVVESSGSIALGASYGRVKVGGTTLIEAEKAITKHLQQFITDPAVQVTFVKDSTAPKEVALKAEIATLVEAIKKMQAELTRVQAELTSLRSKKAADANGTTQSKTLSSWNLGKILSVPRSDRPQQQ